MDPHFNEYLAAVAGMHDVYGEPPCDGTSEFHECEKEVGSHFPATAGCPALAGCAGPAAPQK